MRTTTLYSILALCGGFSFAATIQVNSASDQLSDSGTCSLREAVIAANTNAPSGASPGECSSGSSATLDTIVLPPGTYVLTRTGSDNTAIGGDLDLLQSVSLTGSGRDSTIIDGGVTGERVFHVLLPSGAVSMANLTVRNGASTGQGGGIQISGAGAVTLVDARLTGNTAESGGGLYANSSANVTLTRVTIDSNDATWDGGGIYFDGPGLTIVDSDVFGNQSSGFQGSGGGIYLQYGTASLSRVTVADNIVAGYDGGGISVGQAVLQLADSTIEGNLADDDGGGIYFSSSSSASTITNSTISENSAGIAGGGLATSSWGSGVVTLTHVTVAFNSAPAGSALDVLSVTARNSVISGACADTSVTSLGGNIESPGDNCGLTHATDQVAVSGSALGLGALAFNGGRTRTNVPSEASVALNTARATYCSPRDQRGVLRPQGVGCDVGSVERVPGFIFYDGVETGTLGNWSASVP